MAVTEHDKEKKNSFFSGPSVNKGPRAVNLSARIVNQIFYCFDYFYASLILFYGSRCWNNP